MLVREIMSQPAITVKLDTTLEEIARILLTHNIGGVPVVDAHGKLCGFITESDFSAKERGVPFSTLMLPQVFSQWMPKEGIERIYAAARSMTAKDIMTVDVITLIETDTVEHALRLMLTHDVHRLPVVRDGVTVGVVSRHDLLKLLVRQLGGK